MGIVSGGLPEHKFVQRPCGAWICTGNDQRGYGKTQMDAYNEWVYLIRYNIDGRNW